MRNLKWNEIQALELAKIVVRHWLDAHGCTRMNLEYDSVEIRDKGWVSADRVYRALEVSGILKYAGSPIRFLIRIEQVMALLVRVSQMTISSPRDEAKQKCLLSPFELNQDLEWYLRDATWHVRNMDPGEKPEFLKYFE